MTDDLVSVPWTNDQVASLNAYQIARVFHPFTCGKREDPGHTWSEQIDTGLLVATPDGWVCPVAACDWTQTWAHEFMANWGWRDVWGEGNSQRPKVEIPTNDHHTLVTHYIDVLTDFGGLKVVTAALVRAIQSEAPDHVILLASKAAEKFL